MLKQTIKTTLGCCLVLMTLLWLPIQSTAVSTTTIPSVASVTKPPAKLTATRKGAVQDMIDAGLTKQQAIAYLSLIRDSKGRKIKSFSRYHGKFYTFAKGKPNAKKGKAILKAWLKQHRTKKTKVTKPAKHKDTKGTPSVATPTSPTPSPSVASTATPSPSVKATATPNPTPKPKSVTRKKILKIDLPVSTLTLPINDPYRIPPAKVIYTDGTYEWIPTDNVTSSNDAILSVGKSGPLLNLKKQGETDLIYTFGTNDDFASAKMRVIVGPENHKVRDFALLSAIMFLFLGIAMKLFDRIGRHTP